MNRGAQWRYRPNAEIPDGGGLPEGVYRFAAVLEYDGAGYCGWQRQAHCEGIQAQVEDALSKVANQMVTVSCAGRTDTGVHAWQQVIHFDTAARRPPRSWLLGANANLPPSVRLHWVGELGARFHARFSARARVYRYLILNRPVKPGVMARGLAWYRWPLEAEIMHRAAQLLLGEQDFSAFRGAGCQSSTPMREVRAVSVFRRGDVVAVDIRANAFLLHMVRNIVGSLFVVGRRERPPEWIAQLLRGRDRTEAAATASPEGLYLAAVEYPQHFAIPVASPPPYLLGELQV